MWSNFITGLYLTAIGMGVVFTALFLLQLFVNAISLLDRAVTRPAKAVPAAGTETRAAALGDATEEEAAVIAAAVCAMLQGRAEIHRITLVTEETQDAWSRVGRLDHMRSHLVRGR